jgi:hypothetical protein
VFSITATILIFFLVPILLDMTGRSAVSILQALGIGDNPFVMLFAITGSIVVSFTIIHLITARITRASISA